MPNSVNDKNEAPESELDEAFHGDVRVGRLITSVPRAASAGLMFIPGLIFLFAGRAAGHVGVNTVMATVLVTFVLLLTLLNIFELLGGSSARGGTSSLVYESLGGRSGFITGWSLIAAYVVLYAAMAQLIARHLRALFPTLLLTQGNLAVSIILILSLIQIFRILPRRGSTLPTVLLTFIALGGLLLAASPAIDRALYQNPPFMESGILMRTAGLLIVMFGGLEAVMASRRLIQDPSRNAPSSLLWTLLISGLALAVGLFFASGLPSVYAGGDPQLLSDVLQQDTPLSGWLIAAISIGSLLFALNTGLMTAARQLHMLTRWGALQRNLIAVRRPFRLPPLIFALLAVLATPLVFRVTVEQLLDAGAVFMFVPVVLVNLAALASRRSEPNRRRPFLVPYYPLAPLLAVAIAAGMLMALPQQAIILGFLWLLPGFAFYEVYSRAHLIEAQEGVRVFGRSTRREKRKDAYRVLVPFIAGAERRIMSKLATALASQLQGELIALQVVVIPDPLAAEDGQRLAEERNTLFQWSTRFTAKSEVPTYPITRLARSVHEGILQTAVEEDCDHIFLSWALGDDPRSARLGRVLDPVIRAATSDVVVSAFQSEAIRGQAKIEEPTNSDQTDEGEKSLPIERILATTAGGPHAPLASNLALLLAKAYGATTSGLYIAEPDASQEVIAEGEARIEKTLDAMRQQAAHLLSTELREQSGAKLTYERSGVVMNKIHQ